MSKTSFGGIMRRVADSRGTSFLRRNLGWLPWLLVLGPLITLAQIIQEHAVNVPFLDDFMNVPFFEKASKNALEWPDFFAAQMEHRIAFTRVMFLLFHHFWSADYLKQMWFSWLLLCLTVVNVVFLLRKSGGSEWRRTWPVAAMAALSLCSPVQCQIFLWAFMHQVVVLMFFFTSALLIWQTGWPVALRFLLSLVCVLCATLSFSSAILFWPLLLPVIWWCAPMRSARTRWLVSGAWLVVFAVTMACYFHNLKNESDPEFSLGQEIGRPTMGRNIHEFLADPWKSIDYALRVQGGFLARGTQDDLLKISLNYGAVLMGAYVLCALYAAWRFRDQELRRKMLPWLLLGLYGIGTMFAISLGRVWLANAGNTALSGRYTVHAMTLTMALPVLVWLVGQDLTERLPAARLVIRDTLLLAGALFFSLQIDSWHYGSRLMEIWQSAQQRLATNLLFYKTQCPIDYDFPSVPRLAKKADDLGLLRTPMFKDTRLDHFKVHASPLNESFANWASLSVVQHDDGAYCEAVGCAVLKQYARVPDAVFLTWFDPRDAHWEIFRIAQVTALPLYLQGMFSYDLLFVFPPSNGTRENLSEFNSEFKLEDLPAGTHKVAAWAYDYNTRSVALIPGFFEVDRDKGVVTSLGGNPAAVDLSGYVRSQSHAHHL